MSGRPLMRMTGRLPVFVPQSGQATNLQWEEECYHLRMIEVQRKRCLEEAQLENDTAGEAQQEERAPDPQGALLSITVCAQIQAHSSHTCWVGMAPWRGCWEKLGDQKAAGSPNSPL